MKLRGLRVCECVRAAPALVAHVPYIQTHPLNHASGLGLFDVNLSHRYVVLRGVRLRHQITWAADTKEDFLAL